jgi:hypothetical protein
MHKIFNFDHFSAFLVIKKLAHRLRCGSGSEIQADCFKFFLFGLRVPVHTVLYMFASTNKILKRFVP